MPKPITQVLDAAGKVNHDCAEIGCTISWDHQEIEWGGYDTAERRFVNPKVVGQAKDAEGKPKKFDLAKHSESWDFSEDGVAKHKSWHMETALEAKERHERQQAEREARRTKALGMSFRELNQQGK
jgi:hypothetical protein